jgi:hypothetical protein
MAERLEVLEQRLDTLTADVARLQAIVETFMNGRRT